jgi:hypothetical protein
MLTTVNRLEPDALQPIPRIHYMAIHLKVDKLFIF